MLFTVTTRRCGSILIGCGVAAGWLVAVVDVAVAVAPEEGTGSRTLGLETTVTAGGGGCAASAVASVVAAALASADPIDAINPTAAPTLKARAATRDPAAGCGRRVVLRLTGAGELVIVVT
ncbi:MAG: hypothetical protein MUQ27_01520 [Acidimicrobiia bacterium]|nr:hypothetical protein [Acidimicrobiia bacterium]